MNQQMHNRCFTCLKYAGNLQSILSVDEDNMSYLDKLRACFKEELHEQGIMEMEMCTSCIECLQASYRFRITVMKSQEKIQENSYKIIEIVKTEHDEDIDSQAVNNTFHHLEESVVVENQCDLCEKTFSRNWQLSKHKATQHGIHVKFICPYCGREFKKAFFLNDHLSTHTGEKKHKCLICEREFFTKASMQRHMKSHDRPVGQKSVRTPFLCTICGRSFPFSNSVQRHMRTHTGVKRFQCEVCNRKFSESTHLITHMRRHTGEKPYMCEVCGVSFSIRACMLKHIQSKHPSMKQETDILNQNYFE